MNDYTAVIIGATGLTGNLLLEELLKDDDFKKVRILVRRSTHIIHPKLEEHLVDFTNMDDYTKKFGEGDFIFCCIGTTQKKVKGDKDLYSKIDYDIPVNAAGIGISKGFRKFLIVSAIGADEQSSNFYLQLKGKTENALKTFHFESLHIFQPSILNGNRKETRISEQIVQSILDIISFLFVGPLKKYHAIGANTLAKAMIYASKQNNSGAHFYTYQAMMDMAREYGSEKEEA